MSDPDLKSHPFIPKSEKYYQFSLIYLLSLGLGRDSTSLTDKDQPDGLKTDVITVCSGLNYKDLLM